MAAAAAPTKAPVILLGLVCGTPCFFHMRYLPFLINPTSSLWVCNVTVQNWDISQLTYLRSRDVGVPSDVTRQLEAELGPELSSLQAFPTLPGLLRAWVPWLGFKCCGTHS